MAITFSKSVSTTKLLNAYNNNVVEFSSNNVLDSQQCTINIGGFDFIITPINNVFRFNFAEIVKVLMSNNFNDNVVASSNLVADSSLLNSYLVTYTIKFTDITTEQTTQTYTFVKSVEQIANVSNRLLTEQQILTPLILTMFKGYPFDVAHYSDGNITVANNVTGYNKSLTSTATTTDRIFLSLGDSIINDGINDIITEEYNTITITDAIVRTLNIRLKDINCGGVYLKWFNNKGGWSYWLFNSIYKEKTTVKTLDSFNVDFESIDNTYTTELLMGRTATNTLDLNADSLSNAEMLQIKDILVSPRIELYNGSYGDVASLATWQTVKIKSASQIIANTKKDLIDFKLTIVRNQYTQI